MTAKRDAFVERLASLDHAGLLDEYGPPDRVWTAMAEPGEAPSSRLRADSPAMAQAIGICRTDRIRAASILAGATLHAADCIWCEYPRDVLDEALAYARWEQRLIAFEVATWVIDPPDGPAVEVSRSTPRSGTCLDARWAAWWRSTSEARRTLIRQAQGLPDAVMA